MAYRVQKSSSARGRWRVLWRTYIKDETTGRMDKGRDRHIPASEYHRIGITEAMTYEEAKAALKKLNLEAEMTRRENSRNAIQLRVAAEKEIECIHLPPAFVRKFEDEHLPTKYMGSGNRLRKIKSNWRAAQAMIRTVPVAIDKWHRYPEHFYNYCLIRAYSPDYVKKLLFIVNAWLNFLGFEQDMGYRPLPPPGGAWQAKIATAFEEANKGKASLPLTPEKLESIKEGLNPSEYNWLYCTVWAGLRPNETDALLDKKRTKISYRQGKAGKIPVLEVYQSKLRNVPKTAHRWKRIPLFLPEQRLILDIINSGNLKTPLLKTIQHPTRLGPGHGLYAGRKGFHDLMVTQYSQPELEVIRWLGHRSLDMAMKHYAKEDAVRWEEPEEVA
jgi:hypothetical protein